MIGIKESVCIILVALIFSVGYKLGNRHAAILKFQLETIKKDSVKEKEKAADELRKSTKTQLELAESLEGKWNESQKENINLGAELARLQLRHRKSSSCSKQRVPESGTVSATKGNDEKTESPENTVSDTAFDRLVSDTARIADERGDERDYALDFLNGLPDTVINK